MEAVISVSEFSPARAVKFAAHSFVGEALHWWNTVAATKNPKEFKLMKWAYLNSWLPGYSVHRMRLRSWKENS
jgi:hypothetical protein